MTDTTIKMPTEHLARHVATEAEQQEMAELVKQGRYPLFGIGKREPGSKSDFAGLDLVDEKYLAKNGTNSVSWKSFNNFLKSLSKIILDAVGQHIGDLGDLVDEGFKQIQKNARTRFLLLEQRVAALEQAQTKTLADAFRGSWQPGNVYVRGGLVVWSGGLWLAMSDTDAKPGSSDSWRQVTKPGKDAPAR